ncbi:MAG: hypothetical protein LBK58_06010 [Prevotellaceae bacterium]|jgi:hypothetical protein|nr:hypothetical protein [Prevotellaceae bacterium]
MRVFEVLITVQITHKELAAFTGITGRNNQEERDAALIAWVWAGLEVKVK